MISYAQNFEDVMLNRALGDIQNGFYIDVGANDPVEDSVTKHFYDSGWHGVNIEPVSQHYEALCEQRARDINLQVAVDEVGGKGVLYEVNIRGLSTLDKNEAEQRRHEGCIVEEKEITIVTLQDIWEKYINAGQVVHFLKIDVEGLEERVVRGLDLSKHRPWIILLESTTPNIGAEIGGDFGLMKVDYKKVYFDGLNSFYIAEEKQEALEKYFRTPPNVFDRYKLANTVNLEKSLWDANQRTVEIEQRLNEAEARYKGIISSKSWRYTKPFRIIKNTLLRKKQIFF